MNTVDTTIPEDLTTQASVRKPNAFEVKESPDWGTIIPSRHLADRKRRADKARALEDRAEAERASNHSTQHPADSSLELTGSRSLISKSGTRSVKCTAHWLSRMKPHWSSRSAKTKPVVEPWETAANWRRHPEGSTVQRWQHRLHLKPSGVPSSNLATNYTSPVSSPNVGPHGNESTQAERRPSLYEIGGSSYQEPYSATNRSVASSDSCSSDGYHREQSEHLRPDFLAQQRYLASSDLDTHTHETQDLAASDTPGTEEHSIYHMTREAPTTDVP